MQDLVTALVPLGDWAAQFMLIVARLSFVVMLMPGIGEQVVPMQLRLMLLLGIAVGFSSTGVVAAAAFSPLPDYLTLMLGEVLIGFFLGVSLRCTIWLLSIVGTIVAQSVGLAQFLGIALEHEAHEACVLSHASSDHQRRNMCTQTRKREKMRR